MKKMKLSSLLIILMLLVAPEPSLEWSGGGHRIVARIAYELMTPTAKDFVAEHLSEEYGRNFPAALIDASVYADSVEWSDELHFSHTPKQACAPFLMERDCGPKGRCIVTGIADFIVKASDLSIAQEERAEAIKFLVHLIADIHNPMHVGFAEDRGGNDIHLNNPLGVSLHNVWDYVLVNRIQRQVGVFQSDFDPDGGQPWILSDALISEIRTNALDRRDLRLKINVEDVETVEAATLVAARMASFTAEKFTCKFGYMNEKNEYIEKGDSLTETYLDSRSEIASVLLQAAGVRLAELINNMAKLLSRKRHVALALETESAEEKRSSSPNIFMTLAFDFDPEQLAYKGEDDQDDPDFQLKGLSEKRPVKNNKQKQKQKLKGGQQIKAPFEEPVSKISAEIEGDMKSSISRKNKNLHEEIGDSEKTVILVKEPFYFLVTTKQLFKARQYASRIQTYKIEFAGSNAVTFGFDLRLFGGKLPSSSQIVRTIMKIRNLSSECPEEYLSSLQDDECEWAEVRPPVETTQFPPFIQPFVKHPLTPHDRSQICYYTYHRVTVFLHRQTMEESTPNSIMRTNQYTVIQKKALSRVFVDERLLARPMTPSFLDFLVELRTLKPHRLSLSLLSRRASILHELTDLHEMFFGREEDDPEASVVSSIKWFRSRLNLEGSYTRFHWSISSTPQGAEEYSPEP